MKTFKTPNVGIDPYLIQKLCATARKTGFTSSLVRRGEAVIITIDPQYGDVLFARKNGRNGMYAG